MLSIYYPLQWKEFKLHFKALCESFGIKRKPTSAKNPQANAIPEQVHQVITTMLCTTELPYIPEHKNHKMCNHFEMIPFVVLIPRMKLAVLTRRKKSISCLLVFLLLLAYLREYCTQHITHISDIKSNNH
jgi:hypothetical protein